MTQMRLCSPSPHAASPQIPPRRSFLKAAAIAPVSQAHQSLRARGDGPRGGEGAGILRPQAARVRDNARHGGEGGEPSGARTRKRRNSLVRAAARAEGVGAAGGASGDGERSDWRVARVIRVLREDLPVQYERDLDWSVYDGSVAFVDPVTRLDGLILYRGMISSLRLITAVGFEPGSVVFELHSIEEVPPSARTFSPFPPRPGLEGRVAEAVGAVRSVWSTWGRTRWGKEFEITGDDIFRINEIGKVITHESAWNESPSQVWESFKL